jgi:hypothetical protein
MLIVTRLMCQHISMPKRVKQQKRTSDENEIAFQLVQRATREPGSSNIGLPKSISEYMAQIGSKGGKIGGKRRLKTMTAEQRKKNAQKAAKARWSK